MWTVGREHKGAMAVLGRSGQRLLSLLVDLIGFPLRQGPHAAPGARPPSPEELVFKHLNIRPAEMSFTIQHIRAGPSAGEGDGEFVCVRVSSGIRQRE